MSNDDPPRSNLLSQGSKKTTRSAQRGSKSGVGLRRPPVIKKNTNGNRKVRSKGSARPPSSPIDIIMDRPFTVTKDGKQREVTAEEALELQTLNSAIAGKSTAQREVWKWIRERDKRRSITRKKRKSLQRLIEPDPDNADEALVLLGIAEAHNRCGDCLAEPNGKWRESLAEPDSVGAPLDTPGRGLLLRSWAVQLALSRNRRRLSANEVSEIKRCTRDAETLRWPAGAKDDHER